MNSWIKSLLAAVLTVSAAISNAAYIEFRPSAAVVNDGTSFDVDVWVNGLLDQYIGAFDVYVEYDPLKVALSLVTFDIYLDDPDSIQFEDPTSGLVNVFEVSLGALANQDGNTPFRLFGLTFDALMPGLADFSFGASTLLSDENGDELALRSQDDTSVTVREVTTPVPEPGSLLLMILGLVILAANALANSAKKLMQRKGVVAAKLLGTMLLMLFGARAGLAAPGYTYDLLFSGAASSQSSSERVCPAGVAINNRGDVAYRTSTGFTYTASERIRVYLAERGQAPEVIFDEFVTIGANDTDPSPQFCNYFSPLGINDNGIVAIPARWPDPAAPGQTLDSGYFLVEPGVGVIRTLRGVVASSGRVNENFQMAGHSSQARALVVSDGVTTTVGAIAGGSNDSIQGFANINSAGVAVGAGRSIAGSSQFTTIFRNAPSQAAQAIVLGLLHGSTTNWYTDAFTPGINDAGWVSFSTNSNNNVLNDNPRIVLISPTGDVHLVADAVSTNFGNFWQPRNYATKGTSINNFNRVSFVAQTDDNPQAGNGEIYIGDPSGDPARLAFESTVTLSNGNSFLGAGLGNDITDHGTNSLNDRGEIAISTYGNIYDANGGPVAQGALAVIVARPDPGMEPGNPIIPRAEDALPEDGWSFIANRFWCANNPSIERTRCRTWIDPALAVGYDFAIDEAYAGSFTSVLVPIPLPGGDAEFIVEANGETAALTAGTALNFDSMTPDPVRVFRISDIALTEELDPNDPTAFVTGLTFSEDTAEDVLMTMVPVIVDTDDTDEDGIFDQDDNCPASANIDQADSDGDGVGNVCDNCPQSGNPDQMDSDGDGVGDVCDNCAATPDSTQTDTDGDGVGDVCDNCSQIGNSNQLDGDSDTIGDVCDNCVETSNPDQADADGNDIGDACEVVVPRVCDADADGDVDKRDISLISAARNKLASGPSDPRDADRNGVINVLDARKCTLSCDRARCL